MGQKESLDIEEIKFICRQVIAGRNDTQIKSALEEDWGQRDIRTIRLIRRIFEAGQQVVVEHLIETGRIADIGQLGVEIGRTVDVVKHMSKGLRPVSYDEKTGEVKYETWLEF